MIGVISRLRPENGSQLTLTGGGLIPAGLAGLPEFDHPESAMARKRSEYGPRKSDEPEAQTSPEEASSPKRKGRSPDPPVQRAPPLDLSTQGLADSFFDFASLVARVASSRERGIPEEDQADRRRLKSIMEILRAGQDVLPGSSPGKKGKKFPPVQRALGLLRRNFNAHCEQAAKLDATPLRDRLLGLALVGSCSWDVIAFPQGVDFQTAMQAVEDVRAEGKKRMQAGETEATDWLKALGDRPSTKFTAGALLAAIAKKCRPSGMPASRSSTDKYAARIEAIGPRRLWAQMQNPAEILTFVATAYGVPMPVAPLVAWRMGLTIQETQSRQEPGASFSAYALSRARMSPYQPRELRSDGTDSEQRLPMFFPMAAQPYGILDEQHRREMVENLRKGFESRGGSDSGKPFADAVMNLLMFAPPALPEGVDLDPRSVYVSEYWANTKSLLDSITSPAT